MSPRRVRFTNGATNHHWVRLYTAQYAALTSPAISNILAKSRYYRCLSNMEETSGLANFLEIVTKPDNIPILGMFLLVLFFTWIGLRQAFRHHKLIDEGKKD